MTQLFEWSWGAVAEECETVLGPKGFRAVQIPPPQECVQGPQWWTRYQPVSYRLDGCRSGTADEFYEMVKRCNAVGVRVVVDAVINHMAAGSGVGTAGSPYGNRTYPAVGYTQEHLHHDVNDPSENCAVFDWTNITNVQWCDLGGLPDLATGDYHVRQQSIGFLRTLLAAGDDVGFRFDAAKHIPPSDMQYIIDAVGNPWAFQEVGEGPTDCVHGYMYYGSGHVTAFSFGIKIGTAFKTPGQLDTLKDFMQEPMSWVNLTADRAVTFIDNHDTQAPECMACAVLTYRDGPLYDLASVFMLAVPYGSPVVMSSYVRSDKDTGPTYPVACGDGWVCEHRRPDIANMVLWRRVASTSNVSNFQMDQGESGNRIAFRRGGAFVAFNRDEKAAWTAELQTGLPAGTYCDVIQSDDEANCPAVAVDVAGVAKVVVSPLKAMAFHTGKKLLITAVSEPVVV
eukprot:CAMPEP_0117495684 /NCGR_PEP_ID=MMETSP0784-20121206/20262_1 /TAXON_ID=39447 /ORGANISM="" /LENGTH=453 /DNA_ID=CAMNT_0005290619 /DNA_START=180 /DNA_END=1541 /DNA_ORIENTATION=+